VNIATIFLKPEIEKVDNVRNRTLTIRQWRIVNLEVTQIIAG